MRRILAILFLLSQTAATKYVDCGAGVNGTGTQVSPYNTVANGIAGIASGDTLYIKGTCTFTGTGYDNTWGPSGTWNSGSNTCTTYTTFECDPSATVWSGCHLDGPVRLDNSSKTCIKWKNLKVDGFDFNGQGGGVTTKGLVVEGCEITPGILPDSDSNPDHSNHAGIFASDHSYAQFFNNYIHDVTNTGNCSTGIGGSTGSTCGAGVKFYNGDYAKVYNNALFNNAVEGIADKQGGQSNKFYRNWIKGNGYSLNMNNQNDSNNNEIYENLIDCSSDSAKGGIFVHLDNHSLSIERNTFYNCRQAIIGGSERGTTDSGYAKLNDNNVIRDNVIFRSSYTSSYYSVAFDRFTANNPLTMDYNVHTNGKIVFWRNCTSGGISAGDCDSLPVEYDPLSSSLATMQSQRGYESHGSVGTPTFVGGDFLDPEDFQLAVGSVGKSASSTGGDIGICPNGATGSTWIGIQNDTTYGGACQTVGGGGGGGGASPGVAGFIPFLQ